MADLSRSEIDKIIEEIRTGKTITSTKPDILLEANLTGFDLSNLNLSGINLKGAKLFKSQLVNTNLCSANLEGADLTASNLTNANLSEANLDKAGLGQTTMENTIMFGAKLRDATLTGASINRSDFRMADLKNARMREAKLLNTDCTGASLYGVNMSMSDVSRTNFGDADMRNSRLRRVTGFQKANWIGVDARNINFAGAYRIRRFIVDENYIYELKTSGPFQKFIYYLWLISSDCGRSLTRWVGLICIKVLIFAYIYSFMDLEFRTGKTAISLIYYSIIVTTTLGFGDIVPTSSPAQIVTMIQVFLGYTMLGGFLSILTNKIARRAD